VYGFVTVGGAAMFLESVVWGAVYVAAVGLMGAVALGCWCARCPHGRGEGRCAVMPGWVTRLLVRPRGGGIGWWEKLLFGLGHVAVVALPQWWLWQRPLLMAVYWVLLAASCVVFPARVCRRCPFEGCPFNPAGRRMRRAARRGGVERGKDGG
jgi:hypothetical protein